MNRDVVWSSSARNDYIDIIRYVAGHNPGAAFRLADRIDRAVLNLADMATGRPGRVSGTHEKLVQGSPYILAYEIIRHAEGGERIVVLHVIHGSRNWPEEAWP